MIISKCALKLVLKSKHTNNRKGLKKCLKITNTNIRTTANNTYMHRSILRAVLVLVVNTH